MSKLKAQNSKLLSDLKIALVVEELTQLGGAERILDCLLAEFPQAPIFTLVWDKEKTFNRYDKFDVRTSFLQKLPLGVKRYKWYLLLMPKAVEAFDFSGFDIVLSVTSALIKGIKTNRPTLHICYCNTPTRWLWSDKDSYLQSAPIPKFARPIMPWVLNYLQKWDLRASKRPDYFIANSENVRKRIKKYYQRDSVSIFVPVDTNNFSISGKNGEYYLVVSRLEPYKKVDLVIETFKKLELPLKIVGSGTRFEQLKKELPKNIELVGRLSDKELVKMYQNSIATIFPQAEDAGIVPLESMATGRPVIAYARGGALETVIDGKTGILFEKQTVESLVKAMKKFRKTKFSPRAIRLHAEKFDQALFKKRVLAYIRDKLKTQNSNVKIKESLH